MQEPLPIKETSPVYVQLVSHDNQNRWGNHEEAQPYKIQKLEDVNQNVSTQSIRYNLFFISKLQNLYHPLTSSLQNQSNGNPIILNEIQDIYQVHNQDSRFDYGAYGDAQPVESNFRYQSMTNLPNQNEFVEVDQRGSTQNLFHKS